MNELHNPIYTGQLRGHAIRFFAAPNGVVALPWHSCADLASAAGLPADAQDVFLQMTRSGSFQDSVRMVRTDAGEVLIAPHFVAQGTIGAFKQCGFLPADDAFENEFYRAGIGAAKVLQAGMSPEERFANIIALGRQHLGADDPIYASTRGEGSAA
ncbi:hypothetical protein [Nguyenibacter vanlangensis]|uniref:Uncharacterized protein n=1 Tax=Nguyenibacter vanlangensis TaxID=1216886 RepID=A0A7Y7ISY4_9PROT|nr:hypothetical protein [Nguyenibacter vanlangensis]NVN09740.1 hypothetical protein [Nguyenibacter vanlangensis]